MDESISMNRWACGAVGDIVDQSVKLGATIHTIGGARVIDAGVSARGSIDLGLRVADICLGGLGTAALHPDRLAGRLIHRVAVTVTRPLHACLLSQYAGWNISVGKYFAMGSGPMRAVWAGEKLYDEFDYREVPQPVVGVLEASRLPSDDVVAHLVEKLGTPASDLTLIVARTASLVGSLQVVARSVETCLHKLHEIQFDVQRIVTAAGSAYLPTIPRDDLSAIGRTNDSILYGGEVTLWVDGDDEPIERLGPTVPASSSRDYGEPFADIFRRYGGDFYKIDPLLFSPATVAFHNIATGSFFQFGQDNPALLARSFYGDGS